MAARVVAVVLAAGASRRMGAPKMVLPVSDRPLVTHAIEAARSSRAADLLVVTGANEDALRPILVECGARHLHNPEWEEGLGASIRRGVSAVAGRADAVLLLLGDQPHVTSRLLDELIARHEAGATIAASRYSDGTLGPPALFDRTEFDALQALTGDQGARPIIDRAPETRAIVPFPLGDEDVDHPDDVERATNRLDINR